MDNSPGLSERSYPTLSSKISRQSGRMVESKRTLPEFSVIAKSLRKRYAGGENELEVLKGIDLEIRCGEIVAVVGPSGAGKSTLLHVLGLMDEMTSGDLTLLGWNVPELKREEKDLLRNKYIGFLFQFHCLLPEFTLLENAALPLRIQGLKPSAAEEKCRDLLAAVGLEKRFSHYPAQVSGGEQQRAALARAMATQPALLICDEPTGNLDLERGEEIRDLIWRIARAQHATVLIATHNPEIAKNSDRIVPLLDGKVRERS